MSYEVQGTVVDGFEGVREEWVGKGITGSSLTSLYSITKGAAHLVVALLVQEGVLDLDREVAAC